MSRKKIRTAEYWQQYKKDYYKVYNEKNKEHLKSTAKVWVSKNRKKVNATGKRWKDLNPEKERNAILKRYYGITLKDYEFMAESQKGMCAICMIKPNPIKRRTVFLLVDHCHKTKKVRGLLCDGCNKGLGCFKDDILRLERAITYLKQTNEQ